MTQEFELRQPAPPAWRETRPLYWSVRRELWENRFLTIAPLVVAALVVFVMLMSMFALPKNMRAAERLQAYDAVVKPFTMTPAPIMLSTILVGFFHALDALYGERRDRSILFWKSLPVSDRTAVLAKAAIPLVVLPLYAFALSLIAVVVLFLAGMFVLLASGVGVAGWWREFQILTEPVVMIYGLTVHALWFAPIYGWLLLISAWARRLPLVWAALPLFAIGAVERLAFSGSRFTKFLQYRLNGAMTEAFDLGPKHDGAIESLSELTPFRFLGTPALWAGLVFTALCLMAAVRLRRGREPI
ncbi:MAG TPA: ABC transporter permease [Thermoanaerobaculia bacterium]|nr:ABC transporter permease [Thermoanaerobaculia bacterium]